MLVKLSTTILRMSRRDDVLSSSGSNGAVLSGRVSGRIRISREIDAIGHCLRMISICLPTFARSPSVCSGLLSHCGGSMIATSIFIFPLTIVATSSPYTLGSPSGGPYDHRTLATRTSLSPPSGCTRTGPRRSGQRELPVLAAASLNLT